ncbi:hypothetical protein, partial [Bacillus sp. Xin]
ASIATGLAEVQSGKGFSLASGTFSTQGLNMEWTTSIQAITEEKARKADYLIKDGEMCGRLEEKSPIRKAWDDTVDDVVKVFETVKKMWNGTVIGTGKAVEDEIKSMETLSNMDIRNMDIETFINVTYAIVHLDETAQNMWHAFSSTMKRDIINGDAESRTQWTTYGLTQIAIGLIADKGLGKASLATKGIKGAGGASTFAKGVTLVKELKQVSEILQSFKKDVSYAFSGGNILTKIPQSELNQDYYNFAKTNNATKGMDNTNNKTSEANPKVIEELEGPVIDGKRVGSGTKIDEVKPIWGRDTKGRPIIEKEFPHVPKEHGFSDIVDNYSRFADEFPLVGGDEITRRFFQIEGSYAGKKGIFEWIVEPNGNVSHRRFIENGIATGKPNQVPKK